MARSSLVALVLAASSALCGCITTQSRIMASWKGEPIDRAVASWGAPDATVDLGDGRRVLTWRSVSGDRDGVSTCRQSFTVGATGTIEAWSYSGCPLIVWSVP